MQNQQTRARWLIPSCLFFCLTAVVYGASPLTVETLNRLNEAQLFEKASDLSLHWRDRDLCGRRLLKGKPLAVLKEAVKSPRFVKRQVAVILLGRLATEEAETILLAEVKADNPFLLKSWRQALLSLYSSHSLAALEQRILKKINQEESETASLAKAAQFEAYAEKLSAETDLAPSEAVENALLGFLKHTHGALRAAAADGLAFGASNRVVPALEACLDAESETTVQAAVVRAIGRLRPEGEGDSLLKLLDQTNDPMVQLEVARALYRTGFTGVGKAFTRMLSHKETAVRLRLAELAGELQLISFLDGLMQLSKDKQWRVRLAALQSIAAMPGVNTTGLMRNLLTDTDPRIRAAAALALHQRGESTGLVWTLLDELKGGTVRARIEAAKSLAGMKASQAVAPLERLLSHADLDLSCEAASALVAIGGRDLAPALVEHGQQEKRAVVVEYLGRVLGSLFSEAPPPSPTDWPRWLKVQYAK